MNSRLYNAKCFFGGATLKHSYLDIPPALNEVNLIKDIVILHMITNHIINLEVNKDLIVHSIVKVAGEWVEFSVKCMFISSINVNARHHLAFICVGYKALNVSWSILLLTGISKRSIFGRTLYTLIVQVKTY